MSVLVRDQYIASRLSLISELQDEPTYQTGFLSPSQAGAVQDPAANQQIT